MLNWLFSGVEFRFLSEKDSSATHQTTDNKIFILIKTVFLLKQIFSEADSSKLVTDIFENVHIFTQVFRQGKHLVIFSIFI